MVPLYRSNSSRLTRMRTGSLAESGVADAAAGLPDWPSAGTARDAANEQAARIVEVFGRMEGVSWWRGIGPSTDSYVSPPSLVGDIVSPPLAPVVVPTCW